MYLRLCHILFMNLFECDFTITMNLVRQRDEGNNKKKKMKYHWEADKHGLNRKFTTHFEWWTDYSFKCLISIDWKMKSRHKTLLLPYISSRWKKKWEARKKSSIVKEKRHWWIGVIPWFCVFWELRRGFFFLLFFSLFIFSVTVDWPHQIAWHTSKAALYIIPPN